MKTCFTSHEICHIWAHQSAPYGKSPGNLSFDGGLLLSYRTGIARLIEHKGKSAVLINDRSFSISTTKSQGRMRSALPDTLPRFYVSEDMGARLLHTGDEIFRFAIESAKDCAEKAETMRKSGKRDSVLAVQARWLKRAREASDFFGLRRKVDEGTISRLREASKRAEKKAAELKAKQQAERREKYLIAFEGWKNGGNEYFFPGDFPVAFRVEGGEVVSSLGARFPLEDARRAHRFVTSKRGQAWRENGERCPVGTYAINAISAAGIVAGCHRISWEEIERISSLLA